jgi:hypothetical protein
VCAGRELLRLSESLEFLSSFWARTSQFCVCQLLGQWSLFVTSSSHPVRRARDLRNKGATEDQISQRGVLGINLAYAWEVKVYLYILGLTGNGV